MERSGDEAELTGIVRHGLTELRATLGDRDTVLDRFSYADVAMALALQFVSPVDDEFIKIGARSRPRWTWPELAEEFADLVRWRDRVFERWPSARSAA